MIVSKIESQLGNQLFTYASTKSIANELNYEYRYFLNDCYYAEKRNANEDKVHGRFFDDIFEIDKKEKIDSIASNLNVFSVDNMRKQTGRYEDSYFPEVYETDNNTLLLGHFISTKYFENRIDQVKKWFIFKKDIVEKNDKTISSLKKDGKKLISVHFRVGTDYRNYGYRLKYNYWENAAKKIEDMVENVKFVIFYDQMNSYVKKFQKKHKNSVILHGSLADDLYCLSKCDYAIVCNSTYSIWGGLLMDNINNVIRPSIYPISYNKKFATDCYYKDWMIADAERDSLSCLCAFLKIGKIHSRIINIIHYRKFSLKKNENWK